MSQSSLFSPQSLSGLGQRLRSGTLDVRAYVEQVCDRVDAVEPHIAALLPEADRRARLHREADAVARRYPDPAARPPLYGVLVGVKDIMHADGFETRAGSRLPPDVLTGAEADCVSALRAAGALILGKTVTTEFAYFAPGPTRNPFNPAHTPGGSSSGSAAAVAAGYVPFALGTQTIGSVLRPAAFCGIVGFKPTSGRVSTRGVIAIAPALDHTGILAADVATASQAAAILCAGWQPEPATGALPVLGVPDGPYLEQASSAALALFEAQLERLAQAGCTVRRVALLDDLTSISEAHLALMAFEMAETHRDWFTAHEPLYRPQTAAMIRQGQRVDADTARRARNGQAVTRQHIQRVMDAEAVDLWVAPAATGPAPEGLESTGSPVMSLPWTFAGMPAISLPAGSAQNRMPVGIQLVAGFGADEQLLAWSAALEQVWPGVG